MEAGREFNIHVIAPSHIRRLEAGILSYGADMDIETNPFEVGFEWQLDFTKERFIGKEALLRIKEKGVEQKLSGLKMGGAPITWNNSDYSLVKDKEGGRDVGYVTRAFHSPKIGSNIALAMLPTAMANDGTPLTVALPGESAPVAAQVHPVPFFDPQKEIPKAS